MFKELTFEIIDEKLFESINVIYGVGDNGKRTYRKCLERKIPIYAFFDDDPTRWNETCCGCRVLNYEEFEDLDSDNVNIIVGSLYLKQICDKLKQQGFKNIYAAYEMMLSRENQVYHFNKYSNNKEYLNKIKMLCDYFKHDRLSEKFYQILEATTITGESQKNISNIFCDEPQYFLNILRDKIDNSNFVDAGAYTGDTIRSMIELHIRPKNIYGFEADYDNYLKLKDYTKNISKEENVVCENYALWNECTRVGFSSSSFSSSIDASNIGTTNQVNTMTLDEYFKNNHIGFIKMDIEGAEQKALKGGINVIKRDRPILAISIYHSMEDRVEIPLYLVNMLENYHFIVRHHSYTYSETIIYGIPKEKLGEINYG